MAHDHRRYGLVMPQPYSITTHVRTANAQSAHTDHELMNLFILGSTVALPALNVKANDPTLTIPNAFSAAAHCQTNRDILSLWLSAASLLRAPFARNVEDSRQPKGLGVNQRVLSSSPT